MVAKNIGMRKRETGQPVIFLALVGGLTVVLIIFLIFTNIKISQKRAELKDRVDSLNKELTELSEEKKKLEQGINQAQSDFYWEGKVREQGYKQPGEETVVVLPPDGQKETAAKEQKSFWVKILETIGF